MKLSKEEKEIIINERIKKEIYLKKEEVISKCKHQYYYVGHSHNDDAFRCSLCGNMEYK